jgi:hypothetical protein
VMSEEDFLFFLEFFFPFVILNANDYKFILLFYIYAYISSLLSNFLINYFF